MAHAAPPTGVAMTESPSARRESYHHGDLRRALIDAALALVTEEQDWAFSLRQVARRAGVSHNAPYNHFPEKRDLLGAVAAAGFERLYERLAAAIAGIDDPAEALRASGRAYVNMGTENPALYRLMFGSTLGQRGAAGRPAETVAVGDKARNALEEIVRRGARAGAFAVSPDSPLEVGLTTLALWSMVHGLTLLIIDSVAASELPLEEVIDAVVALPIRALRKGGRKSAAGAR
jgi:AcrR family transcriptional regulator